MGCLLGIVIDTPSADSPLKQKRRRCVCGLVALSTESSQSRTQRRVSLGCFPSYRTGKLNKQDELEDKIAVGNQTRKHQ